MRRISIIIALLLPLAAVTVAAAAGRSARPGARACGGTLWRMKTFSDAARDHVKLTPRQTTIGAIADRAFPRPLPRARTTAFQRQTWQVIAQIVEYRLVGNELRLVLFDDGTYMNAVIPAPSCLSNHTRARDSIESIWEQFAERCGRVSRSWQPQGAVVYIRGVGFWSSRFTARRGAARNGAELHPVTGFRAVAGCAG